jgi:tripartite-type tricarboxylate transporter receptor subunit TctC
VSIKSSTHFSRRSFLAGGAATSFALASGSRALANDWPSRTVSIIVPYAAGGHSDLLARLLAQYLSEKLSKSFVVDNRPGGAGVPAAMAVSEARPDGCTILFGPPAPYIATPLLQNVSYSTESFAAIGNFVGFSYLLGVKASLPFKNVGDLVNYARANPGKLNYASAGVGSGSHLSTAMFLAKARMETVMVPYKSAMLSTGSVLAGETDFVMASTAELVQYMNSTDRIRIIATTHSSRLPDYPDLPTVQETVPGYTSITWNGIVGPRGTPPEIIERFGAMIREALTSPAVVAKFKNLGVYAIPTTPSEFAQQIMDDKVTIHDSLKAAGLLKT